MLKNKESEDSPLSPKLNFAEDKKEEGGRGCHSRSQNEKDTFALQIEWPFATGRLRWINSGRGSLDARDASRSAVEITRHLAGASAGLKGPSRVRMRSCQRGACVHAVSTCGRRLNVVRAKIRASSKDKEIVTKGTREDERSRGKEETLGRTGETYERTNERRKTGQE